MVALGVSGGRSTRRVPTRPPSSTPSRPRPQGPETGIAAASGDLLLPCATRRASSAGSRAAPGTRRRLRPGRAAAGSSSERCLEHPGKNRQTVACQGQRSPRLKPAASNGRIWTAASSATVAILDHSPAVSSNASSVRSADSTSHRWRTRSRAYTGRLASRSSLRGRWREDLADPVRREREVRGLGIPRHPVPAPTSEVGDEDVVSEVQLGLDDDPPAAGAAPAELKRRAEVDLKGRPRQRMRRGRSGIGVQHTIDDLGHNGGAVRPGRPGTSPVAVLPVLIFGLPSSWRRVYPLVQCTRYTQRLRSLIPDSELGFWLEASRFGGYQPEGQEGPPITAPTALSRAGSWTSRRPRRAR